MAGPVPPRTMIVQHKKNNNVLLEALGKFKPEEIALSFNCGKNCTVTLHLLRAACNLYEESVQKDMDILEGDGAKKTAF